MKGNPTAGIILLLVGALFIAFGTKHKDRLKQAWNVIVKGESTNV
jgi:hypothetical protein